MNAILILFALAVGQLQSRAEALPLMIEDAPSVWMHATLSSTLNGFALEGVVRRTAPRTVRSLRGHMHLYLGALDGSRLGDYVVRFKPEVVSQGRVSTFRFIIPELTAQIGSARLNYHTSAQE